MEKKGLVQKVDAENTLDLTEDDIKKNALLLFASSILRGAPPTISLISFETV